MEIRKDINCLVTVVHCIDVFQLILHYCDHMSARIETEFCWTLIIIKMDCFYYFKERLAKSHGSQCGFCTPGIIMSMYTLLRNDPQPTIQNMEKAFEGNIYKLLYWPEIEPVVNICSVVVFVDAEFYFLSCCRQILKIKVE